MSTVRDVPILQIYYQMSFLRASRSVQTMLLSQSQVLQSMKLVHAAKMEKELDSCVLPVTSRYKDASKVLACIICYC